MYYFENTFFSFGTHIEKLTPIANAEKLKSRQNDKPQNHEYKNYFT